MATFHTNDGVTLSHSDTASSTADAGDLAWLLDHVDRFDRPFVMLAARESQLWPGEHATAVVGNPSGRAVDVEDCGHPVAIDQPDRLVEELVQLLPDSEMSA